MAPILGNLTTIIYHVESPYHCHVKAVVTSFEDWQNTCYVTAMHRTIGDLAVFFIHVLHVVLRRGRVRGVTDPGPVAIGAHK